MVREIETYEELVQILQEIPEKQLVILDCFAVWCGPCTRFAPYFEELAEKHPTILFLKADVEKVEELTTELKVTAMPTFLFFKNLAVTAQILGVDPTKLEELIQEHYLPPKQLISELFSESQEKEL